MRVRTRTGGAFDRRLLPPLILGSVLNPVNSSMIAVSLIPIGVAFGAPPSQTAWLVSALYLATAIGQPVVGRLVDRYGPRPLFLVGSGLTALAGLAGAVAPDLAVLVAARVVLGFGTCAGFPAAMSMIRSEARRTGQDSPAGVLTVLAVSTQTIAVIGPTLGGLLIGLGGWRTIFAVNVPLGLASLLLGLWRLPRTAPSVVEGAERRDGLDFPGMALFAAMLVSLLLFLMDLRPDRWWLPVVTLAAGAGLVARELRTASPFLDLRVFGGNLPLLATYLRTLLAYTVSYSFLYGFTQWLEQGYGLSASQAGLLLLPMFGTGILVSSITGRRKEIRGKLLVGGAAALAACAMLLLLGGTSPLWLLIAVVLVIGVPQGLVSLANQNAVYHQADPARIGASAGLLRTFMYLGAIVASATNGGFFRHGATTHGLHQLAAFVTAAAALGLLVTALDRSLRRVTASAPASAPASSPS
jgi:MFS family permease